MGIVNSYKERVSELMAKKLHERVLNIDEASLSETRI